MSDTCFMNGLCGVASPGPMIHKAIDSAVLAPFVVVKIIDKKIPEGAAFAVLGPAAVALNFTDVKRADARAKLNLQEEISVGNKSKPAIVKSMSYGSSNGGGCDIEIVDEEAGSFAAIFEKINRGGTATGTNLSLRFGWIRNDCAAGITGPPPPPKEVNPLGVDGGNLSTPEFVFVIQRVNVTYSGGMVHYTLNCIDTLSDLQNSTIYGTYDMHLKEAIEAVMGVRNLQVEFKKFTGVSTSEVFKFDRNGDSTPGVEEKGPKRKWEGQGRRVLECVMEWCRSAMAKGPCPKGIKLFYEPTPPPRLICMADIPDRSNAIFNAKDFNIGTYVVNGGNCSPVLRFQPSIQWPGGMTAYAATGTAGGSGGGTTRANGPSPCINSTADQPQLYGLGTDSISLGGPLSIVMQRGELETRINQALRYSYNATLMNNLANAAFGGGISAELTLQGNPNLSQPLTMISRYVNLIVINPFTIKDDCRWSTGIESCNQILSNGNWMIEGLSHNIQPGTYTTTLKIKMLAPGAELSVKAPDGQAP